VNEFVIYSGGRCGRRKKFLVWMNRWGWALIKGKERGGSSQEEERKKS
jgi:hypothetical protein